MSDFSNLHQMFGEACTDGNFSRNFGFGGGRIIIWIIIILIFCRGGFGGNCGRGGFGGNCGCGGFGGNCGFGGFGGFGGNNCCCNPCCCDPCSCCCDPCSCCCCEPCCCKCKECCCCCGGVIKGHKKQKNYIVETCCCNPCCCNNNFGSGGFDGNCGSGGFGGFGGNFGWCQIILIIVIFLIRREPICCKPC
ncbi:hypothetical protein [Clostridium subterminale]|uniref:hypothetical protein n=1 Tax=Clostridium subterminale TaxID=1550 RepID=UPI0031D7BDD9